MGSAWHRRARNEENADDVLCKYLFKFLIYNNIRFVFHFFVIDPLDLRKTLEALYLRQWSLINHPAFGDA